MDTAPEPFVGRTIGQYEIVAKRGGGGMGIVYTARDTRLGRIVALKFLPPQWSHDETAKQRFVREAQAASATDHRNICTIHDIRTADDGQLFIVMAHYDGPTLKQRLESGALPIDEAIDIAAQVAEGLAKAHGQGIVHRDIKPGNLILTEDSVKILDFGLAKFADALQLTIAGSTLGTMAYMSPEQVRAEEADARSDIWAVGVVLYEMLAGAVPFKGAYAEAIFHAIRSVAPAPIERSGVAIPEPLWRIVSRCLEKDPAARYQSARELARELRLLQGRTLPIELRADYVTPPPATTKRPWWRQRTTVTALAVLLAAAIGFPLWILSPVERVPAAVAPVVNQTGYADLEPYRLPLTMMLVDQLTDSPTIRPLPYERLLQIIRAFRRSERDVSSRDALQAIASNSPARVVLLPTLLYENGAFRARVEVRDPSSATNLQVVETPSIVSALPKDAAYALMPAIAAAIESGVGEGASRRASLAAWMRTTLHLEGRPAGIARPRTLEAAAAIEQGLDAYEQQEYGAALVAFVRTTELDPEDPIAAALHSRVARIMRHDEEAADAARQADRLITSGTRPLDGLYVRAVVAEARGDLQAAETGYRALIDRHPDATEWQSELGAFLERQRRASDAVAAYQAAAGLDTQAPRPHLELCRLYGPLRLNDPPKASQEGERALAQYRRVSERAGEAQTLWCLADVLNIGGEKERAESQRNAELARDIFETLGYPYNLSRAYNYLGLAASAQGRYRDGVTLWTRSLELARTSGNVALEPAILSNLAVMYRNLGQLKQAVALLGEGYRRYETLGDQQRAAHNQVNAASIIIEYGAGDLDRAVRDVQNALGVLERAGDRDFQVFSLQVLAGAARNGGYLADAESQLNRALAIARASNLDDEVARITTEIAEARIASARYIDAQALLRPITSNDNVSDRAEARSLLAIADMRLGDGDAAQLLLTQAQQDVQKSGNAELTPRLYATAGELAYERGDLVKARIAFDHATSTSRSDVEDAAVVEARAFLALFDSAAGAWSDSRTKFAATIADARRMRRVALEARCKVLFAQAAVRARRPDDALQTLDDVPSDNGQQTIGPELRAQVQFWRSQALAMKGDDVKARAALAEARRVVGGIQAGLPATVQQHFMARRDIHAIVG